MIDSFLSEVRALFQHGRNIDIRYFKSLSEIGEKMETFNYETISSVDQKLDTESDSLLSLTAKCHDGHQGGFQLLDLIIIELKSHMTC